MLFGPHDSNKKLKASDGRHQNYAIDALKALNEVGRRYKLVSKESLPDGKKVVGDHLRGITIKEEYAILTTLAENGYIIKSEFQDEEFSLNQVKPIEKYIHPGGIQAIGSYIVVPVYNESTAAIQIYNFKQDLRLIKQFETSREKAYCIGITNTSDEDGEYYVLAVVQDIKGKVIDFYRTTSGIPLSNGKCKFNLHKTWHYDNSIYRDNWQPDKLWFGYPYSLSLMADEENNVYLLGFRTGSTGRSGWGKDIVDLYHIDLDKSDSEMMTKLASFHAKLHHAAFRWGASACVTSDERFQIITTERNTQKNNTEIRLNILRADDDWPVELLASKNENESIQGKDVRSPLRKLKSALRNGGESIYTEWNTWKIENYGKELDLSGANLDGADLSGADFTMTNFSEANLGGANLGGADLYKANFHIAVLQKIDLSDSNLHMANLHSADLNDANLEGANLSEANLSEANLTGKDLSKAYFSGTNLTGANLSAVNLKETYLSGSNLSGANLSGANLSGANLSKSNLSGANLSGANLSMSNLSGTNFKGANLSGANLTNVNLTGANLSEADLNGTDLSKANLSNLLVEGVFFSGAVIRSELGFPIIEGNKDIQAGINGILNNPNDSAALMTMIPPGDSMQGSNPEAVIQSLKRGQKLHGISFGLAATFVLLSILGSEDTIVLFGVKIPPELFGLFTMPISIGLLSLVSSFMADGLQGAHYLSDRKSAMSVGNFPWALSKYGGRTWTSMIQSFITRFVMSFHPLVYPFFYFFYKESLKTYNVWFFFGFLILLLGFSTSIFILSQKFQKPILFDRRTEEKHRRSEEERKNDLTKLTEAVREQTSKIAELIKSIKLEKEKSGEMKK